MELYEALKSGTSLEELEAAFRDQVKKAQERIAKEKAEQEEKDRKNLKLAHQRTEFAKSMINYIALILDEDPIGLVDSTKEIEQKLLEFEEDLKLINAMPEEQKAFMADDYVMTLSLQQSLANWQFHVERQKRIEEAMKREAETKEEQKEEPKPVEAKPEEPEEYEIEVLATSTQMEQIKRFLSVQMGVRCTVRVKRTAWDDGLPF